MKKFTPILLLSLFVVTAMACMGPNQDDQSIDLNYSVSDTTQNFDVADTSVYLTRFSLSVSLDFNEITMTDGTLKLNLLLELPGNKVLNPLMWDAILIGNCDALTASNGAGEMLMKNSPVGGDSTEVSLEVDVNISGSCDSENELRGGLSIVLETMDPAGTYFTRVRQLQAVYEGFDGTNYPVKVTPLTN